MEVVKVWGELRVGGDVLFFIALLAGVMGFLVLCLFRVFSSKIDFLTLPNMIRCGVLN